MALLGTGVLAIWNGIAPGWEADFVAWHVNEHIPERVGVPGFLRGRRYVAQDGHPQYFNFYEAETAEVFASPPYQARLNDPTPWTQRVIAHFTDTSRTVCDVVATQGLGEGSWIEAIQLETAAPEAFAASARGTLLPALRAAAGIVAVHLLRGRPAAGGLTVEARLRGRPDATAAWILLIEAVGAAPILALRGGALAEAALRQAGAANVTRGLYALQFALSRAELDRAGTPGAG